MTRFTIREVILLTVIVAIALAWWRDHQRLDAVQAENTLWRFRAEFLQSQFNGTKFGDKWMMPFRWEFDPESAKLFSLRRTAGGDWIGEPGTKIEWRQDWADAR
jgi:hypothetical protein